MQVEGVSEMSTPELPREFHSWVAPHLAVLRRVAVREVGSARADDVVQETLLRAWKKRASFDPARGSVRAWLLAITINQCRRAGRQVWARLQNDEHDDVETGFEGVERRLDVEVAVRSLSTRQRQVVVLHYLADLPVEEVAQVLRISAGSVKTHLRLARAHLQTTLGLT